MLMSYEIPSDLLYDRDDDIDGGRVSGGGGGGTTGGGGGSSSSSSGNNNPSPVLDKDDIPTSGKEIGTVQNLSFLNIPSDKKLSLVTGSSRYLKINIVSSKLTAPPTLFTSSNTSVATITRTGTLEACVVAVSAGTSNIKVSFTDSDGSYYEDTIYLTVLPSGSVVSESIPDDKKIWLVIGEKRVLSVPDVISISSSSPEIASTKVVSGKGKITAWTAGICTVTITTSTGSESYCVIVTNGNGTNYLDVVTFEKSSSWENLNLGSVFVVGCNDDEVLGTSGTRLYEKILSPSGWRELVGRSYKELKVSKIGQDLSIKVTPPGYLEDKDSESDWISKWESSTDKEILCNFVGIGVYRFNVQSNCPVRFKTSSEKISIGPWTGTQRLDYTITDFGNNRYLPIHVLELPSDSVETIEITYESPDSRISETLYINLYPPLPGLVSIRSPYIYVVPGDVNSYNQRIEIKSYCGTEQSLRYSGIEYPTNRDYINGTQSTWVSDLSSADKDIVNIKINITDTLYPEARVDEDGLIKYYLTLKSVTGYTPIELPTAPVARIKFEISDSLYSFDYTDIVGIKNFVYYYIYVLPSIPSKNLDTYQELEECPTSYTTVNVNCSVFNRLRATDFEATWPGTNVKFVDSSGMSRNFSTLFDNRDPRDGVNFMIKWTGTTYDWNQTDNGGEVGTLVIKWYYNKDYLLGYQDLIKFQYYIEDEEASWYNFGNLPYNPDNQFYTQTVHFIKFLKTEHILNSSELPEYYSAIGTYDPTTMNPHYKVIKTDISLGKTIPVGGGYWKYYYREEEIDGVPIQYTCEQNEENSNFLNLTIEPRGNNVSFPISEWEELISYNSMAFGEIKFICESNINHNKSYTVMDSYSFKQAGLEDCILIKDKLYLGRAEINLPDQSYESFNLKFGDYGIRSYKISDIRDELGQLSRVREIENGLSIKVWKDGSDEVLYNQTATKFSSIDGIFSENNTGSEITYIIEVIHSENIVSFGSGNFESKIILRVKQKTKSSDVYVNTSKLPYVFSYGNLGGDGLILYTSIPKNKIVIEEVTYQDSSGRWVIGDGIIGKPKIYAHTEETPDPIAPEGYRCYMCLFSLTPNSSFATIEGSESYLGEDIIRRIRVRHADIEEGSVYELKQGYYTLYPTLMYKATNDQDFTLITEKDSRNAEQPSHLVRYNMEEGFWQIGTEYNPIDLPPFRNSGSSNDAYKVWISLMALRHEVSDGNIVSWVNTTSLFNKGVLEIDKNYRVLKPDTIEKQDAVLLESDWFNSIQTDLVIHSTDKTSEKTWEVLQNIPEEDDEREDIEFPALETIYTASRSGFYERHVLVQENIELKLGVLRDNDNIFYNGSKPYTVGCKIRIWYRKIGEDIKDE